MKTDETEFDRAIRRFRCARSVDRWRAEAAWHELLADVWKHMSWSELIGGVVALLLITVIAAALMLF